MAEIPYDLFVPTMQPQNNGKSVLIMTADNVQDLEFFYPYYRFIEEGFHVDVVTLKGGEFEGKGGMGLKDSLPIREVDPEAYDLLYIPGGKAPAKLKKDDDALELVERFA